MHVAIFHHLNEKEEKKGTKSQKKRRIERKRKDLFILRCKGKSLGGRSHRPPYAPKKGPTDCLPALPSALGLGKKKTREEKRKERRGGPRIGSPF